MKYLVYIIAWLLVTGSLKAQSHEIGLVIGGANYIGDIGSTTYIDPNEAAYGFIYRLNRSDRHTYRLSFMRYNIKGDDFESEFVNRRLRGYSFTNAINELSLGMEFSFWEFNLHNKGNQASPYIHFGLGVINYKDLFYSNGRLMDSGRVISASVPISLGYKARLLRRLIVSAEISAKYTFTDNLDGSKPKIGVFNDFGSVRSVTNNDWFVFSGIMLTYTFGKRPCLCKF